VNYTDGILCLMLYIPQNLGETLQTIGWDISDHMAGQFGPWGWTIRHLGLKCLLETLVLVPKCQGTLDPSERC